MQAILVVDNLLSKQITSILHIFTLFLSALFKVRKRIKSNKRKENGVKRNMYNET